MRIACVQFSPRLGQVSENIARVDALLAASFEVHNLDFLILPELALTGYNFLSLEAITPYLEPTAAGASFQWAKSTAACLGCNVTVGYPELASPQTSSATISLSSSDVICYNSTVTVSPTGEVLAHYRKTHLYYTDETWAQESPTGWLSTSLPLPSSKFSSENGSDNTKASFGICMDLNPYQFTAPWKAYEFSTNALRSQSQLLLLSMAWLNVHVEPEPEPMADANEPDMQTIRYWCSRLQPLIDQQEMHIVVVIANRCGVEEPNVNYAGTSWIGRIGKGKIKAWEILGKREESVLVADTEEEPRWALKIS